MTEAGGVVVDRGGREGAVRSWYGRSDCRFARRANIPVRADEAPVGRSGFPTCQAARPASISDVQSLRASPDQ